MFSPNVSIESRRDITDILNLVEVSTNEKYLGLPPMLERHKMQSFNFIEERIRNKVSGWKAKLMSGGGKEVLIKAVAQAIPSYAMSIFRLPLNLCSRIQQLIAKYWWSSSAAENGIHWLRWSALCKPKFDGGLGFRKLMEFNQALLAKQSWRIYQFPDLLMSKVLKNRYFPNSEFYNSKLGSNPSYVWRSILWGKRVFIAGSRWRIGNGISALIYKSNWMPRPDSFKPFSPKTLNPDAVVADLFVDGQKWNEDLIKSKFLMEDAEEILRISLPREPQPDKLIWHYEKRGTYTVKSDYQISLKINASDFSTGTSKSEVKWKKLWSLDIPPKVRIFAWKAVNNLLPTGLNLFCRKMSPVPTCQRCKKVAEDIFHVLFLCPAASKVWSLVASLLPWAAPGLIKRGNFFSFFWSLMEEVDKQQLILFVMVLWNVWCARNRELFQNCIQGPELVFRRALLFSPLKSSLEAAGSQKMWIPPDPLWLKINVDAAVNFVNFRAGIGCIIRNHKGSALAALHKNISFNGDVELAEALAVLEGFKLGLALQANHFVVESDALNVVDMCLGKFGSEKEVMWTIAEIRNIMSRNLNVKVSFFPRSENSSAHLLAKLGLKNLDPRLWLDEMPNFLVGRL